MCGIAGIIFKDNSPGERDRGPIQKMSALIEHRGPDAAGIFTAGQVQLAHRRLSIIDVSSHANQPFDYDSRITVVYNGEIYNYIELRDELSKAGYQFRTQSDTEVLCASYLYWGHDCVSRFNGMWSFAIYDRDRKEVFLSRDRFGIKPLYYTEQAQLFAFSSEMRQLVDLLPSRKPNRRLLADFLLLGFENHTEETVFDGIVALPPAHNLIYRVKEKKFHVSPHYQLKPVDIPSSPAEIEQEVAARFDSSVTMRLRADVKVGTCLSGGVDSSCIAAIAGEKQAGMAAITAASLDPRFDESAYAQKVAEKVGLEWHVINPSSKDFDELLDEVVLTQEQPFSTPSVFLQYIIMRKARSLGCKVMLDGQGGDEVFLGYLRYLPTYVLYSQQDPIWRRLRYAANKNALSTATVLAYSLYFSQPKLRLAAVRYRNPEFAPEVFGWMSRDLVQSFAEALKSPRKLQQLEIFQTQLSHLLHYEDRSSMRNSIEARVPFLDHRLVELAVSLPLHHKIFEGWTKYAIRKILAKHLPDQISWRRHKIGFAFPDSIWLKDRERMANEILDSRVLRPFLRRQRFRREQISAGVLWKLFNVARWENIFGVS